MQDLCTDTGILKEVGAPGELSAEGVRKFLSMKSSTSSLGCIPAGQELEGGVVSLASARSSYTPSLVPSTWEVHRKLLPK